jgi:hypothetical protein
MRLEAIYGDCFRLVADRQLEELAAGGQHGVGTAVQR